MAFSSPLVYAAIVFTIVASIVLHELGHVLVATWQGDPTPRLRGHMTWNPVVHIGWGSTPVQPRYFRNRRWGSALVSFAGPAVHVFLILIAAAMVVVCERSGAAAIALFWGLAAEFNAMLLIYNMIPVPPFDGFGVLE